MRLKNKETGEIKEFALFDGNELQGGATLESLMKEWEDAPEEEYYWVFTGSGGLACRKKGDFWDEEKYRDFGNCFKSEDEASAFIEKLRAFKRLRDHGLRFEKYQTRVDHYCVNFTLDEHYPTSLADLELVFGGD